MTWLLVFTQLNWFSPVEFSSLKDWQQRGEILSIQLKSIFKNADVQFKCFPK